MRTHCFLSSIVAGLALLIVNADASAGDPFIDLGVGRQPQVVVSAHKPFVVYGGEKNQIFFKRIEWGGGAPVLVAAPPHLALGMRRGPRIAAAGNAIVITAISGEKGGGKDGDCLAWRSTDEGKTWQPLARPLNSASGSAREGFHAIVGGPEGLMICVWLDLRNANVKSGGTELWGAISKDSGSTWSADELIYRSAERTICQCCQPSAAIENNGAITVMFRNVLAGNRDMYVVRREKGAKSFGEALPLSKKYWPLDACPMDGGSTAAGKKGITTWRRKSEIFTTTPGGAETSLGNGEQPVVAIDDHGQRYFAWITARPGDLMLKVGDRDPVKIGESANDPAIAAGRDEGDPVMIAWESNGRIIATEVGEPIAKRP